MKPLDNEDQWPNMYVYQTSVLEDLLSYVTEFLGECEHMSEVANCKEISTDTVTDMEAFREKRKELLLKDFFTYYQETEQI